MIFAFGCAVVKVRLIPIVAIRKLRADAPTSHRAFCQKILAIATIFLLCHAG